MKCWYRNIKFHLCGYVKSSVPGFRGELGEIFGLFGYYAGFTAISYRRFRTTYRSHLQGSRSARRIIIWLLNSWRLIGCPQTSVRNYHCTLHNMPEEHKSQSLPLLSATLRFGTWRLEYILRLRRKGLYLSYFSQLLRWNLVLEHRVTWQTRRSIGNGVEMMCKLKRLLYGARLVFRKCIFAVSLFNISEFVNLIF